MLDFGLAGSYWEAHQGRRYNGVDRRRRERRHVVVYVARTSGRAGGGFAHGPVESGRGVVRVADGQDSVPGEQRVGDFERGSARAPETPAGGAQSKRPREAEPIVAHALEKDTSKPLSNRRGNDDRPDVCAGANNRSGPAATGSRNTRGASVCDSGGVRGHRAGTDRSMALPAVGPAAFWAREEAIPALAKLNGENNSLAAFLLLKEAERYLPGDTQLQQIAGETTESASITSSPTGASVEIQGLFEPRRPVVPPGRDAVAGFADLLKDIFRWKVS